MNKLLALVVLAVAALPSAADYRRFEYGGYRIGNSDVMTDQDRIHILPVRVEEESSRPEEMSKEITADKADGQKIVKWWAYQSKRMVPATHTTPSYMQYTNSQDIAGADYSMSLKYDTVGYSPAYVVVDYDWVKYNLSYDRNGGSGTLPASTNNVVYTNSLVMADNTLSRTGYTWSGWTNDLATTVWTGGETVTGESLGLKSIVDGSNVVMRAKWTPNAYTVKFDANGGTGSMDDQLFTYGTGGALTSNAFARVGYTFDGWAKSPEGSKQYDDGQAVSNLTSEDGGEVTLYARWSLVYYSLATSTTGTGSGTVSLSPSGGSYTNGVVVQVTATPANGSAFTQWSDGVTDNPRTCTMTSNISVSAVFAISTYAVTFKDYDDAILLSQDCNYGDAMPYPPADPSREGYVFTGWLPVPPDTVTRTAVYTAQYEAKSYTVRFHSNYGNGADESGKDQAFTYGTYQNLASVSSLKFAKDGYTFARWKERDGGQTYEDGEQVLSLADHGVVHLDAQWAPIAYTISFDGNGADSGSVGDIAAEYGVEYLLPQNGFVKMGRAFKHWRQEASGATYEIGDSVSNLTTTAGATVTFYAVWSEPRYIAFNGNGAGNGDAMAEDVITFEGVETKALVSNKFEKTGYTFGGWATNETKAAALDVAYIDGADVVSTNLWMAIGETNVLFAVWQTNAYTVVFNANGGTGNMDEQSFVYDQEQALSKCTFASSLMFMGWATNETGVVVFGDNVKVSNLTTEADGAVNLYAVWDNGVLSKAMHCDNLFWTTDGSGTDWDTSTGPNKGHNPSASSPSGSSVDTAVSWTDSMDKIASKKLKVHPELAGSAPGKLSFWYKTSSLKSDLYSLSFEVENESMNVALSTEWKKFGPIYVSDIGAVKIYLSIVDLNNGDNCSVEIDQMTWVPAGAEPTDEDRPTISRFAKTADGFTLSVDQSNISDSFSYQILATNELVGGDWPVKETLSAEDISKGYEIVVEDGEPNMFYKVKVVPK